MNSEFNLGNKTYNPSSNDSYDENIIFPYNKSNHIIIDGVHKNIQFKEVDKSHTQSAYKLNTNLDKNRFFSSSHYKIESNGNESKQNCSGILSFRNIKKTDEGKFSKTNYINDKENVKCLKKQISELNGEKIKLRYDSNLQNHNILELNYKQKSKELATEFKQENNFMRFQLENLRKSNTNIKSNPNIKSNNFINNNGISKKFAKKFGHVRDYHIKLFPKKIGSEDNKEKIIDDDKIDNYIKNNEELKKKNEIYKNELDKLKNVLNITKKENDDLKQNIVRLNNAIQLTNQKNNNDDYEKNELKIKIYKLNEEKDKLRAEFNNFKNAHEKVKVDNNKYKKELIEYKKQIENKKKIDNKEFIIEINNLKKN